jgi:hypothetical protein
LYWAGCPLHAGGPRGGKRLAVGAGRKGGAGNGAHLVKVDTKNPDRGPLLILDGGEDHTVPWAIANASYKKQRHNDSVTEIAKIPNRGHALTIDSGWREVADTALAFVKRLV